jgi:hypothetical protein
MGCENKFKKELVALVAMSVYLRVMVLILLFSQVEGGHANLLGWRVQS